MTSFPAPTIALAPAVARRIALLWEDATGGYARLSAQFGAPEEARRRNCPRGPVLSAAITALGRLEHIVRSIFTVFAVRLLELDPGFGAKRRAERAAAASARAPCTADAFRATPLAPKTKFFVTLPLGERPAHFAHARPSPMRIIARKLEGLRRLLARADANVRRLARIIRKRFLFYVRYRAKALRGPYGEALHLAREAARWALKMAKRPDTS